jgi:ABC-type Mn2+/Zn2+ transport system permease subunit
MTRMTAESLALAVAMAVAAGLMGCFAVMRRMSLAADPLSHVALPGIGLALAFHIHPLVGAVVMLFFGALMVWALEERSRAATETMIGVVFSAALAVGALTTSGEELVDALVGRPGALGQWELAFGLIGAVAVIIFVIRSRHALVVTLVSPEVARTAGINVRRLNLLYLELFALTIALGLRYDGQAAGQRAERDDGDVGGPGHHGHGRGHLGGHHHAPRERPDDRARLGLRVRPEPAARTGLGLTACG